MLTLSRRVGEVVLVGKHGAIVLVEIGKGQVKLGFQFPREVRVVREEITDGRSEAAAACRRSLERREQQLAEGA